MKRTANLIVQHLLWRGLYFFSILILNVLISRLFAAEKSGQIFYITNNLAFLLLLASISLESGAVYFISSGKINALKMARFCILWTLVSGGIVSAVCWLGLRSTGSSFFGNQAILGASLLFIAGVLLTTFFNALFYSKQQFGLPNKILFGVNAGLILLLIFGNRVPWISNHFLVLYFLSYFLQGLLLTIGFFLWYPEKRSHGIPPSPILKKAIRYSLIALIANIVFFLVKRMDYWFVERYCSANDLGNYIQASKLGQMMLIIPSILASTLFPLFSTGNQANTEIRLESVVRVLFWFNLILCLFVLCFGNYLLPWIFGKSFDKIYILFVLLIPGILALSSNYPISAWFSAKDRIRVNIYGALLALLLIFVGDLLILPRAGLMTASVVSSLGYLFYYCYTLFIYRKTNPSLLKDFFLIRKQDLKWFSELVKQKIPGIFPEKPFAP